MPARFVRGDIVQVNLDPTVGHEMAKSRPCVVVQNDIGNRYSATTIVAVVTSAENVKKLYPFHVLIPKGLGGLAKPSVVKCDQIRTVDERRCGRIYGHLPSRIIGEIDGALKVSLALT
jgi:mRNA interferase MazF